MVMLKFFISFSIFIFQSLGSTPHFLVRKNAPVEIKIAESLFDGVKDPELYHQYEDWATAVEKMLKYVSELQSLKHLKYSLRQQFYHFDILSIENETTGSPEKNLTKKNRAAMTYIWRIILRKQTPLSYTVNNLNKMRTAYLGSLNRTKSSLSVLVQNAPEISKVSWYSFVNPLPEKTAVAPISGQTTLEQIDNIFSKVVKESESGRQ